MLKKLLANLTLLAGSLLLCLLVLELLLRQGIIQNPQYTRLSLGTVEAQGEERGRVLILGDSFIRPEGPLFEALGKALSAEGYSVLNTAIEGSGPLQYQNAFRRFASWYQPDLVLFSFYVGNDLSDVQYSHWLQNPGWRTSLKNNLREWLSHFYSFHFFRHVRSELQYRRVVQQTRAFKEQKNKKAQFVRNPWLIAGAAERPNYLLDNLLIESAESKAAWTRISEILGQLAETSRRMDAELAVVIFPREIQMTERKFDFFSQLGYRVDPRLRETREPQRLMLERCEELKLPCLDLLPTMEPQIATGAELYFSDDDHLNEQGDAFAATQIGEFLLRVLAASRPRSAGVVAE